MAQVALAWSISNDFVSAPIVGSTSKERLQELIGESSTPLGLYGGKCDFGADAAVDAVGIKLSEEEIKSISEPYEPRSIVSGLTCDEVWTDEL